MAKTRKSPFAHHRGFMLNAEQTQTLMEIATLAYYSDGFTYTAKMMKLNRWLANWNTAAARRECLAHAAARELAYVAR
jgi:hypothetical protein